MRGIGVATEISRSLTKIWKRRLSFWLLLVLAFTALVPTIADAAVSKEDPAVTAAMRDKLSSLRNAYKANDPKAVAVALDVLFRDALAQTPVDLVKRYSSLEVIAREGIDGLQPVIYRYAMSIFKASTKIDPKTISELRGSFPLVQSTTNSFVAANCPEVLRKALTDKQSANLPGVADLAGLSCFTAQPEVYTYPLTTSGTSLPPRDACEWLPSRLIYELSIPSTIPSASISSIEVLDLPFPGVLASFQDWLNKRWVAVTPVPFGAELPAWAQTASFTIRVTTTTGYTDFPVTFPINYGIHVTCSSNPVLEVSIGNNINMPVYANGPQGTRFWGGARGLPAGLSFAEGTLSLTGHGVVTGTVQTTAINGNVTFAFAQGTQTVSRAYDFQVKLKVDSARVAQLVADQTIVRGQAISLQLPTAWGGDGVYLWTVGTRGATLPAGLSLVQNNRNWFVSGTVANNALLDRRFVTLALSSARQTILLTMTFDSRRPLKTYTQNMILFPEHIVDPIVDCLPMVAWPPTYAACTGFLQAAQDAIYNANPNNPNGIHNTDADNAERAGYLIDHINAQQYDLVALQEVWDGPLTDAQLERIVNDTSGTYRAVQGQDNQISFAPPDLKINSGLLTLVKPTSLADHAEAFVDRGPGSDSYSNKGFVATKVIMTNHADEFVWVINTHTHAENSRARGNQFQQIKDFVARLPLTNPVLILGDLNVAADDNYNMGPGSEYAQMLNVFPSFEDVARPYRFITATCNGNAYAHQWHRPPCGPDKRIDYILLRQGTAFAMDQEAIARVDSLPQVHYTSLCVSWNLSSSILCHYSDHFGLRVDFKFRNQ